ncbi:MAG: metallophosphatase family protein [Chloroflexota bacterium]|nr:metallophosphatase family protein [Chloroflexota bacterium]
MKIAALYDIHGNLPALDAVLQELASVQPDVIIVGGDIVSGPLPGQTLARLQQAGEKVVSIRGNGDREVVATFDGQPFPPHMSEETRNITSWVARHLERAQRDFLAQLPEQVTFSIEGLGDVMFCHATPRSDEEIFTAITPQERLASIFAGIKQQIVVCGHTHMQFERQAGGVRILNAGSVGMPYADAPGAYWLLLEPEGYTFHRTIYNLQAAAQQVLASGYPQAQEFAEENVLQVPTAAEATDIFERMATET